MAGCGRSHCRSPRRPERHRRRRGGRRPGTRQLDRGRPRLARGPCAAPRRRTVLRGRAGRVRPARRRRRDRARDGGLPRPLRRARPMPRRRPPRHAGRARVDRRLTMITKAEIVDALESARRRTLGLLDPVPIADQLRQVSPLMSPLCWDLAHIGHYEELWLIRELTDAPPTDPLYDDIYDAFKHARRERDRLPILDPAGARAFDADVRKRALDILDGIDLDPESPLMADGFVYGMVVQHEHQHDETLLATLQLDEGLAHPDADGRAPARNVTAPTDLAHDVLVDGGTFTMGTNTMGTSTEPWAYDNEQPAHTVSLAPFRIDTTPVTNGAFAQFVADGGYDDARHWAADGWAWRTEAGLTTPQFWQGEGDGTWSRVRFGRAKTCRSPSRCSTSAGSKPMRSHDGLAHACPPSRNGSARPRVRRSRPATCGTTTPTGSRPTQSERIRKARVAGVRTSCSATSGSGRLPTSPRTPAFARSPTASTPRCSGARSTRCCAAARGPRTRRDAHDLPQLGLPDPSADLRRVPLRPRRLTSARLTIDVPPPRLCRSARRARIAAVRRAPLTVRAGRPALAPGARSREQGRVGCRLVRCRRRHRRPLLPHHDLDVGRPRVPVPRSRERRVRRRGTARVARRDPRSERQRAIRRRGLAVLAQRVREGLSGRHRRRAARAVERASTRRARR